MREASGWIFLTIVLDVFPYIFLQYLPFRDKLKYGYLGSIALCTAVLLAWFVPFPFLMAQPWFTLSMMLLYRASLIVPLLLLSFLLIRKSLFQNLFVFSLMLPYVLLLITASGFMVGLFHAPAAPLYMVSSLCRIFLAASTFPIMLWLFRRFLIPAMALQDGGIWKYAWPIPASFNFIGLFFLSNDYEINGASLAQLLGYLSVMACSVLTCLLVAVVLKRTQERAELLERERHSAQMLSLQAAQYEAIRQNMEQTKAQRHDLRHQLAVIRSYSEGGDNSKLTEYLDTLVAEIPDQHGVSYCENIAVNAIVSHYAALAEKSEIKLSVKLTVPEHTDRISDTNLCVIFGNLLENAIEACERMTEGERFIRLYSRLQHNTLTITVDNSFDGMVRKQDERLLSSKRTDLGIGTASVTTVAEKHGGGTGFEADGSVFKASVYVRV